MMLLRPSTLFVLTTISLTSFADHPSVGMQGNLSSPIITTSTSLMKAGQISLGVEYQFISLDGISNSQLIDATEHEEDVHSTDNVFRLGLNLTYGFSNKMTFGVSVPYVRREGISTSLHHLESEAHDHGIDHGEEESHENEDSLGYANLGNSEGLGDVNLYGLYQLSNSNSNSGKTALIFGVKAPTGDTNQKDSFDQKFEVELQPGSGSWDPFIGISWSKAIGSWSLDSNILYTVSTEGDGHTKLGDRANYNFALSSPFSIANHSTHTHTHNDEDSSRLSFVMEINGEWSAKTDINGEKSANSGGHVIYFSPGISYKIDTWLLSASIGLPYLDLNGLQAEPTTRLLLRLGKNFH